MNSASNEGPFPVTLGRDASDNIVITWSDDLVTTHSAARLRKICPCANCREKKRGEEDAEASAEKESKPIGLPILSAAEARPLRVEGMRPVGTYAYQVSFSDGHSSGIFPFALFREGETDS